MATEREEWVDIIKGIGILLVVIGHVTPGTLRDFIFTFHMPLFFVIGGYLYRTKENIALFFREKSAQLLIPYCSFLVILSIPFITKNILLSNWEALVDESLIPMVIGGQALTGWFSAFWFITCYFVTLQVYNALNVYLSLHQVTIVVFFLFCLSFVNSIIFSHFWLPLNLNVVAGTMFLFHIGYIYKNTKNRSKFLIFSGITILSVVFFMPELLFDTEIDYKYASYGIPLLSQIVSFSIIILLIFLSKIINTLPIASTFLKYLGINSLLIMLLHQPIQITIRTVFGINEAWIVVPIVLIICAVFNFIFQRSNVFNKYFLGKYIVNKCIKRDNAIH